MSEISRDAGVLTALAQRLVNQRLPRALGLKDKVERGEVLDDFDLAFLEVVLNDARSIGSLLDKHPEFHDIAGRMLQLYKEITTRALENEEALKRS